MSSESPLRDALRRLTKRFAEAWENDEVLRQDLRDVLQTLCFDDAEQAEDELVPPEAKAPATELQPAPPSVPAEKLQELQQAFLTGALGAAPQEKDVAKSPPPPLELVAERCRLKSEACLVASEREAFFRENPASPEQPYLHKLQNIIARAKGLPECYLWICERKHVGFVESEGWEVLAQNFTNLASSVALLAELRAAPEQNRDAVHDALQLVAEAQSAVRCGIAGCCPHQPRFEDRDQFNTFEWLRLITQEEHHYVSRHMRIDDLADATAWDDLNSRITALRESLNENQRFVRQRTALLGKIRYELKTLSASTPDEARDRWRKIVAATCDLVEGGMPPSHKDLRDVLQPALEDGSDPGDDLPESFQLVLREIDRYVAQQERIAGLPAPAGRPVSPELMRVRHFLAGRTIILIGGDERPNSRRALCEALGLADVIWVATRPHEATEMFEAPIARSDVALVLLAIRWTSHSYAGVKTFCDRHHKPLVRLPGGYNANQVAAQITAQCGALLEKT